MDLRSRVISSPIGPLTLAFDDAGALVSIDFGKKHSGGSDVGADAVNQLEEYFQGRRREFNICLAPHGTPFQLAVWNELLKIPFGQTRSYGDVARALGRPTSTRAVGAANGANPIPIVIPCHRVIGSDGSLIGFGGGLEIKARLLEHEGLFSPALL